MCLLSPGTWKWKYHAAYNCATEFADHFVYVAAKYDASIREGILFADLIVTPARYVELRQDELSACIRFG